MSVYNNTSYYLLWFWNESNRGAIFPEEKPVHLGRGILIGFVLGTLSIGAMVGNILVVLAVRTNKKLRTITNLFVVSLATADLLVSILVMPLGIVVEITGRWWFGFIVCDMWISFDVMLCTASILNLCCISLDRYFAITKPLIYATKRSKKLALIMIAAVWVSSVTITVPPLFGWQEEGRWDDPTSCHLTRSPGYIIYSSLGSFYVPLVIMLFVYFRIFKVAKESEKRLRPFRRSVMRPSTRTKNTIFKDTSADACSISDNRESESGEDKRQEICQSKGKPENGDAFLLNSKKVSRVKWGVLSATGFTGKNVQKTYKVGKSSLARLRAHSGNNLHRLDGATSDERRKERAVFMKERKAAKTLAIVVGGFVVCWLPFFLMYVIEPFCYACYVHPIMAATFTWLGYFNSFMNPFIYAFYNKDFRFSFWMLTWGRCRRRIGRV